MSLPKIYTDENAARAHLESLLWPDGPYCPHCGNADTTRITKLKGNSTRPGVHKCNECEKPFTVTVGTVFERSKIKLHTWLYATHLLTASKKGMSAHQLHRTINVSYKTAWFMFHRIREGMRAVNPGPMGGPGKIVEADETYQGRVEGAPKRLRPGGAGRNIVFTLVERGGSARSFHIEGKAIADFMPIIRVNVLRETRMNTDEAKHYYDLGKEYAGHDTVNHSADEYARYTNVRFFPEGERYTISTNTVEGYYSIFKRGMKGIYRTAQRSTCTVIWRNLISATRIASSSAMAIRSAATSRCRASRARGSPIGGLVRPTTLKQLARRIWRKRHR
jgi:transposase-like protein